MAIFRFLALLGAIWCLVVTIPAVHSQERDNSIQEFLTPLLKGKTELAFDKLAKSAPILHADKKLLDTVKRDYTSFAARSGKLIGFEKIEETSIGANLRHTKYILRGDKLPILWEFALYDGNAQGAWQIIEIKCISQLLETEPSGSLDKSGL